MSKANPVDKMTPAEIKRGTTLLKRSLPQMLKGGVIMDVVTVEQAKIAEDAGAAAVMALERVPSDIRRDGGVARMTDPELIDQIMHNVTIPVMAKVRIGHFVEAQILESIGVDVIDESEVLTMADDENHIDKHKFIIPFVCGARNLGEALRRISEGASMIRTKGEAGTGYTQFFRDGSIASTATVGGHWKNAKVVYATDLVDFVFSQVRNLTDILRKWDIGGPMAISAAILGAAGYNLASDDKSALARGAALADRDELIVPMIWEGSIEALQPEATARLLLDVVYQGFGMSACPYFDQATGVYKPPNR